MKNEGTDCSSMPINCNKGVSSAEGDNNEIKKPKDLDSVTKGKDDYSNLSRFPCEDVAYSDEILAVSTPVVNSEYAFSVRSYPFVLGNNKLIRRQFIVLQDKSRVVVGFTNYHKYIHSSRKRGARHISDDGNNRFAFVAAFLNHIFFKQADVYHLKSVTKITVSILQEFFIFYGTGKLDGVEHTKGTVDRCAISVIDFLSEVIRENPHKCILKLKDFVSEEEYMTKCGLTKKRLVPRFDIYYSKNKKDIFRDIPNAVFNIFLSYAAEHYQDIFFLIVVSAFAGLRPGEACNVTQYNLRLVISDGRIKSVEIDLLEEHPIRSDLVNVGRIKKERVQKVYPKFIEAFEFSYKLHMKYLEDKRSEAQYAPLSVNRTGMAYTYNAYYSKFQHMVEKIKPLLKASDDPEVREYGLMLDEVKISPHIFRHWFSVRLVLYGEDVAGLQHWRGDKSPESALRYLKNKGELEKQLRAVSEGVFNLAVFESALKEEGTGIG